MIGAGFGAAIGALAGMRVRDTAYGDAVSRARSGRRATVIAGVVLGGGWVVLTGLSLLAGPSTGVVLVLLVAVTVVAWWWRRPDRGAGPWGAVWSALLHAAQQHPAPTCPVSPSPVPSRPFSFPWVERRAAPLSQPHGTDPLASGPSASPGWSTTDPGDLSTAQLCLAWQRTYLALVDLPAGAPRADLVRRRTALLDEIERRDPDGFAHWLDTGARAGSDPSRYLAG